MSAQEFDLVVVGGGPGGYVAAIRAAQLGLNVALVEREHLGGICLNWGCIPTKALLRSAEVYHLAKTSEQYGFKIKDIEIDLDAIVKRSRGIAKQLNAGVGHLLKKNKVEVLTGHARLLGGGRLAVEVDGVSVMEVSAKNIILATGARARDLPGMEADGNQIWSYRHALVADSIPKRLLVVGSGAIGIEFASF
ncbi:MAG: FAD-dependent oxidoreductase, partial [Rhodospirillaceae bacterium]|nr:FAD-dependent oxidoreductase [Rhodospirillaceae bacterium]